MVRGVWQRLSVHLVLKTAAGKKFEDNCECKMKIEASEMDE